MFSHLSSLTKNKVKQKKVLAQNVSLVYLRSFGIWQLVEVMTHAQSVRSLFGRLAQDWLNWPGRARSGTSERIRVRERATQWMNERAREETETESSRRMRCRCRYVFFGVVFWVAKKRMNKKRSSVCCESVVHSVVWPNFLVICWVDKETEYSYIIIILHDTSTFSLDKNTSQLFYNYYITYLLKRAVYFNS